MEKEKLIKCNFGYSEIIPLKKYDKCISSMSSQKKHEINF